MAEKQVVAPPDNSPVSYSQAVAMVAAAEARILEQVAQTASGDTSGLSGGSLSGGSGTMLPPVFGEIPFAVWWDADHWTMNLPPGCLTVDGTDVALQDPDDLQDNSTYYLHVKLKGKDPEAVISDDSEEEGYDLHLKLVEMGDGEIANQFVVGALHLGNGGGAKLCFEPEYDDDGELSGEVSAPYVMVGRKIIEASGSIQDNALNGVVVTHSSDSVTAQIRTISGPTQNNSDPSETTIPLYSLSEGKIETDYRGMPVVPLYDSAKSD